MHVVIATDGTMDAEAAGRFGIALAGDGGSVTVLTIVEVNRNLLRSLRAIYGERHPPPVDQDAEYVGVQTTGAPLQAGWPGDDEMIARYLDQQREARTAAIVSFFEDAGFEVQVDAREGEDPAAGILAALVETEADVVIVGSHGSGVFEGLLGSTGTKVSRRAPCPVLVLREAR